MKTEQRRRDAATSQGKLPRELEEVGSAALLTLSLAFWPPGPGETSFLWF